MKRIWPVAVCIVLALILSCANPVRTGLQGLKTDLDKVANEIKRGTSLIEQASDLEKQVMESPSEYLVGKIDALKEQIRKVVSLEIKLKTVDDSLSMLEGHPKATGAIKDEIVVVRERIKKLRENLEELKATGGRLDELRSRIVSIESEIKEKETMEKPTEKIEEEESGRKKIEKKTQ